jgi:hypothetical protein
MQTGYRCDAEIVRTQNSTRSKWDGKALRSTERELLDNGLGVANNQRYVWNLPLAIDLGPNHIVFDPRNVTIIY